MRIVVKTVKYIEIFKFEMLIMRLSDNTNTSTSHTFRLLHSLQSDATEKKHQDRLMSSGGVSCMASSRSCWCHPHLCLPSTKCRTSSFEGGGCRAGHNITMEIGNWAYSLCPGCHHMLDQGSPAPINKFHGCSGQLNRFRHMFQAT